MSLHHNHHHHLSLHHNHHHYQQRSSALRPQLSQHNLHRHRLPKRHRGCPRPLSRAERINFKAIYDEEAFHAELASTNCATVFDMENVAAAFATTVCDAATQVNAPLLTGRRPLRSVILSTITRQAPTPLKNGTMRK